MKVVFQRENMKDLVLFEGDKAETFILWLRQEVTKGRCENEGCCPVPGWVKQLEEERNNPQCEAVREGIRCVLRIGHAGKHLVPAKEAIR